MKFRTYLSVLKSLTKQSGKKSSSSLSAENRTYLSENNPRLRELKALYYGAQMQSSLWSDWEERINLQAFRREDDFLSQGYRSGTWERYLATAAYIGGTSQGSELLGKLTEDNHFGVKLWEVSEGMTVSRDLLDSVSEISFLYETLVT